MSAAAVLAFLLTAGIGLALGLLGGGGSILALPVLVYVARIDPREAVAMSLAIVGASSLVACLMHRRQGRLDTPAGTAFGITGLPGAYLGSKLTWLVPPRTLLVIFAVLMFVAGGMMLARSLREPREGAPAERRHVFVLLAAGFGVGALTGFLGIGGGFIIVPALVFFAGLPMPAAVGTSLLVIALNCAAGLLGHLGEGAVPLTATTLFAGAAIAGGVAGERLSARTSPRLLRRCFGSLVIALGLYVLARNLHAVL
jgi:uncharacterized membrane protein YfcA